MPSGRNSKSISVGEKWASPRPPTSRKEREKWGTRPTWLSHQPHSILLISTAECALGIGALGPVGSGPAPSHRTLEPQAIVVVANH